MSNICGLSAERLVGFINDKATDFSTLESMTITLSEAVFSGIHEEVEKFNMIELIQTRDNILIDFLEDIAMDIQEGFDSNSDLYEELLMKSPEDIGEAILTSLDSKAKYEESRLFINTKVPEAKKILLTTKNLFNDPTQVAASNGSINDINPFDPQLDSMRESALWMSIYENSFKSTPSEDPYDYIESLEKKPYFGSTIIPEIDEIATTYFEGQEGRVKSGLRPYAISVIYNAVIPTHKRNGGLQLDPSQAILDIKEKFKQDAEILEIDVSHVAMILERIANGTATDVEFASYYAFVAYREFDSIIREFGTIFIKTKNGYKYDTRKYRAQQTFSTQEGGEKAIQSSDNLLGFIYSTPVVTSTPNGMYRVIDFMRESDILVLNDEITKRKEEMSTTVATDIFEAYKGKENASPTATYPKRLMHSLYLRMFSNRKHSIIDMQNNVVEHNSFRSMSGTENLTHRIWSQLSSAQPNDMYSIVYGRATIKLGRKALFNRAPMVDHAASLFTVGKNDNIVYKLTQKDLSIVPEEGGFAVKAVYKGHTYSFSFEGEYNSTLTGIKPTTETLSMLRTQFNNNDFDLLKLFNLPGYMADKNVVTEYRKRFPYVERSSSSDTDDNINSLEYIVANMAFILALNIDANLNVLDEISPGTVSQKAKDKSGHSLGEDSAIYIDFSPFKVLFKQRNNWDSVAESINGFLSPAIIYNVGQDIEQSHNPMDTVHKARYNFIKFKKEGKSAGIGVKGFELAGIVWKGGYAGYGVAKSTKNLSPGESFHVTINGLFLGMLFDSRHKSAGFLTGAFPDRGKIPFSQINATGKANKFLYKSYSRGKDKKPHPIEVKAVKYNIEYYQKRQEEAVLAWKKALREINSDGKIFIDSTDINNIRTLSDIDNIIINKYNLKLKDVSPYLVLETHYQAVGKGDNPSVRIKPELRYYVESVYNNLTNGLSFLRKMERVFMNHALSKSGFNFRITSENMTELNNIYSGSTSSITKDVLFSYFWQAQIYMPMVQRSTFGDITQFKGSVSKSNLFNNSYLIKEGSSPAESRMMLENMLIQEGLSNIFMDMGKRGGSAMTGYISPSLVTPTTVGSMLRSDANSQNIDRMKDENWYWKEGGGYKMTFQDTEVSVRSGGANSSLRMDPSDGEQWAHPLHVLQKHSTVIDTFNNDDNHADKSMSHSNTGESITMSKSSIQSKFTNENLRQNPKLRALFRAMNTSIIFRSADNTDGIRMQLPSIIWDEDKGSYVIDYFRSGRTITIYNYNELFEALGGVNSDHLMTIDGQSRDAWGVIHSQILSENNSKFFPDYTPAERDKITAGMTNKYIHIISTPSSEKTGATNINTRDTWDDLENDPDVKYHRISFENYGIIYNAGHDSDASDGTDLETHINMVTQVIQTSGVGAKDQSLSQSIREAVKVLSDMGIKSIDDRIFDNSFGVIISMANGFGSPLKHNIKQLLTQAEANSINSIIRNPAGVSKRSLLEIRNIISDVDSRTDGELLNEARRLFNRQTVEEALRLAQSASKVRKGYEDGDLDGNSKQINKVLTSAVYSMISKTSVRHHFKGNYLVLGSAEDVAMLYPVEINGRIKWMPWEDFQKSKYVPFKEVTGLSSDIIKVIGNLSSSDTIKVVYNGKTIEQPIHLFQKDFQQTNPLYDLTQMILNGAQVYIKSYAHLTDSNGELLQPRNLEYLHHKRRVIKDGKIVITDSTIFDSDAYKAVDSLRNSPIKEYNPVSIYHNISNGITGLDALIKSRHGMITDGTVFRVRNEDRSYTMYKWTSTGEDPMTGVINGIYEEYPDYYTHSRYTEDEFNIYLAYNENANISYEQYYDSTDIRMDINADIHEALVRYEKLGIKELLEDTLDYITLDDGTIVDSVLPENRFIDEKDFSDNRSVGKFLVTVNGVTMWNNEGVLVPISATEFTEIPFEKGVSIKVKAVSQSAWHTRPTELIAPPNFTKTFYIRDGKEGTKQDSLEDFFGEVDYSELSENEIEDIYNEAIKIGDFSKYSATAEARHLKGVFQKRIFEEFDKGSSSHVAVKMLIGSPILGDTASLDLDNYDFEKEIENGRLKSKEIRRKSPAALIRILNNDLKFVKGLAERYSEFKSIADKRIDAIIDAITALESLSNERGINDDIKISIINNYNLKLAEFQDEFIEDTSSKLALSFRASLQMFFARVPTQGGQSYSWGQITGFKFSTANTVYTSAELVAISGADFDIDKLFIMKYNIDSVGQFAVLESERVFKGVTYTFKTIDSTGKILINEENIEKYIQARVTDFEASNIGKEGPMSDMQAKRQHNYDVLVKQFKNSVSKLKEPVEFLGKTYEFTTINPTTGRAVKNRDVINQYIADAMSEFDRQMYNKDSKMVINALKESAAFKRVLRAEYISKVQNIVTNSLITNSGDPRNYIQATTPVVMDILERAESRQRKLKSRKLQLNAGEGSSDPNSDIFDYDSSSMFLEDIISAHNLEGEGAVGKSMIGLVATAMKLYGMIHASSVQQGENAKIPYSFIQNYPKSISDKMMKNMESVVVNFSEDIAKYPTMFIPYGDNQVKAITTQGVADIQNTTKKFSRDHYIKLKILRGRIKRLSTADTTGEIQATAVFKALGDNANISALSTKVEAWELFTELLSASVDNAKHLILAKLGMDPIAAPIVNSMIIMGFNLDQIMMFLNRPHIKKILDVTRESVDSTSVVKKTSLRGAMFKTIFNTGAITAKVNMGRIVSNTPAFFRSRRGSKVNFLETNDQEIIHNNLVKELTSDFMFLQSVLDFEKDLKILLMPGGTNQGLKVKSFDAFRVTTLFDENINMRLAGINLDEDDMYAYRKLNKEEIELNRLDQLKSMEHVFSLDKFVASGLEGDAYRTKMVELYDKIPYSHLNVLQVILDNPNLYAYVKRQIEAKKLLSASEDITKRIDDTYRYLNRSGKLTPFIDSGAFVNLEQIVDEVIIVGYFNKYKGIYQNYTLAHDSTISVDLTEMAGREEFLSHIGDFKSYLNSKYSDNAFVNLLREYSPSSITTNNTEAVKIHLLSTEDLRNLSGSDYAVVQQAFSQLSAADKSMFNLYSLLVNKGGRPSRSFDHLLDFTDIVEFTEFKTESLSKDENFKKLLTGPSIPALFLNHQQLLRGVFTEIRLSRTQKQERAEALMEAGLRMTSYKTDSDYLNFPKVTDALFKVSPINIVRSNELNRTYVTLLEFRDRLAATNGWFPIQRTSSSHTIQYEMNSNPKLRGLDILFDAGHSPLHLKFKINGEERNGYILGQEGYTDKYILFEETVVNGVATLKDVTQDVSDNNANALSELNDHLEIRGGLIKLTNKKKKAITRDEINEDIEKANKGVVIRMFKNNNQLKNKIFEGSITLKVLTGETIKNVKPGTTLHTYSESKGKIRVVYEGMKEVNQIRGIVSAVDLNKLKKGKAQVVRFHVTSSEFSANISQANLGVKKEKSTLSLFNNQKRILAKQGYITVITPIESKERIIAGRSISNIPTRITLEKDLKKVFNLTNREAEAMSVMWDNAFAWIANRRGITKPEAYSRFLDSVKSSRNKDVTEKGRVERIGDMHTVYGMLNADKSTAAHELAHVFQHFLTNEERIIVEKWAVGEKKWTKDIEWTDDNNYIAEKFAKGFEEYLRNPPKIKKGINKLFQLFSEMLSSVYNGIVTYNKEKIKLSSEMEDIYKQIVINDKNVSMPTDKVMLKYAFMDIYNLTPEQAAATANVWDKTMEWIANKTGISKERAYRTSIAKIQGTEEDSGVSVVSASTFQALINVSPFGNIENPISDLVQLFEIHMSEDEKKVFDQWAKKRGITNSAEKSNEFKKAFVSYIVGGTAPTKFKGIFREFASWLESVNSGLLEFDGKSTKLNGLFRNILTSTAPDTESDVYAETDEDLPGSARVLKVGNRNYKQIYRGTFKNILEYKKYLDGVNMPYHGTASDHLRRLISKPTAAQEMFLNGADIDTKIYSILPLNQIHRNFHTKYSEVSDPEGATVNGGFTVYHTLDSEESTRNLTEVLSNVDGKRPQSISPAEDDRVDQFADIAIEKINERNKFGDFQSTDNIDRPELLEKIGKILAAFEMLHTTTIVAVDRVQNTEFNTPPSLKDDPKALEIFQFLYRKKYKAHFIKNLSVYSQGGNILPDKLGVRHISESMAIKLKKAYEVLEDPRRDILANNTGDITSDVLLYAAKLIAEDQGEPLMLWSYANGGFMRYDPSTGEFMLIPEGIPTIEGDLAFIGGSLNMGDNDIVGVEGLIYNKARLDSYSDLDTEQESRRNTSRLIDVGLPITEEINKVVYSNDSEEEGTINMSFHQQLDRLPDTSGYRLYTAYTDRVADKEAGEPRQYVDLIVEKNEDGTTKRTRKVNAETSFSTMNEIEATLTEVKTLADGTVTMHAVLNENGTDVEYDRFYVHFPNDGIRKAKYGNFSGEHKIKNFKGALLVNGKPAYFSLDNVYTTYPDQFYRRDKGVEARLEVQELNQNKQKYYRDRVKPFYNELLKVSEQVAFVIKSKGDPKKFYEYLKIGDIGDMLDVYPEFTADINYLSFIENYAEYSNMQNDLNTFIKNKRKEITDKNVIKVRSTTADPLFGNSFRMTEADKIVLFGATHGGTYMTEQAVSKGILNTSTARAGIREGEQGVILKLLKTNKRGYSYLKNEYDRIGYLINEIGKIEIHTAGNAYIVFPKDLTQPIGNNTSITYNDLAKLIAKAYNRLGYTPKKLIFSESLARVIEEEAKSADITRYALRKIVGVEGNRSALDTNPMHSFAPTVLSYSDNLTVLDEFNIRRAVRDLRSTNMTDAITPDSPYYNSGYTTVDVLKDVYKEFFLRNPGEYVKAINAIQYKNILYYNKNDELIKTALAHALNELSMDPSNMMLQKEDIFVSDVAYSALTTKMLPRNELKHYSDQLNYKFRVDINDALYIGHVVNVKNSVTTIGVESYDAVAISDLDLTEDEKELLKYNPDDYVVVEFYRDSMSGDSIIYDKDPMPLSKRAGDELERQNVEVDEVTKEILNYGDWHMIFDISVLPSESSVEYKGENRLINIKQIIGNSIYMNSLDSGTIVSMIGTNLGFTGFYSNNDDYFGYSPEQSKHYFELYIKPKLDQFIINNGVTIAVSDRPGVEQDIRSYLLSKGYKANGPHLLVRGEVDRRFDSDVTDYVDVVSNSTAFLNINNNEMREAQNNTALINAPMVVTDADDVLQKRQATGGKSIKGTINQFKFHYNKDGEIGLTDIIDMGYISEYENQVNSKGVDVALDRNAEYIKVLLAMSVANNSKVFNDPEQYIQSVMDDKNLAEQYTSLLAKFFTSEGLLKSITESGEVPASKLAQYAVAKNRHTATMYVREGLQSDDLLYTSSDIYKDIQEYYSNIDRINYTVEKDVLRSRYISKAEWDAIREDESATYFDWMLYDITTATNKSFNRKGVPSQVPFYGKLRSKGITHMVGTKLNDNGEKVKVTYIINTGNLIPVDSRFMTKRDFFLSREYIEGAGSKAIMKGYSSGSIYSYLSNTPDKGHVEFLDTIIRFTDVDDMYGTIEYNVESKEGKERLSKAVRYDIVRRLLKELNITTTDMTIEDMAPILEGQYGVMSLVNTFLKSNSARLGGPILSAIFKNRKYGMEEVPIKGSDIIYGRMYSILGKLNGFLINIPEVVNGVTEFNPFAITSSGDVYSFDVEKKGDYRYKMDWDKSGKLRASITDKGEASPAAPGVVFNKININGNLVNRRMIIKRGLMVAENFAQDISTGEFYEYNYHEKYWTELRKNRVNSDVLFIRNLPPDKLSDYVIVGSQKFTVSGIKVVGNTVLTDNGIRFIYNPYTKSYTYELVGTKQTFIKRQATESKFHKKAFNVVLNKTNYKSKQVDGKTMNRILENMGAHFGVDFQSYITEEITTKFGPEYSNAFGFVYGGELIINTDKATLDTPLHEFGHMFFRHLRNTQPEVFASLAKKALADPLATSILESYPELENDTDGLAEEVLTSLLGLTNQNNVLEMMGQEHGIIQRFIDFIRKGFNFIFGIKNKPYEINTDSALYEILNEIGTQLLYSPRSILHDFVAEEKGFLNNLMKRSLTAAQMVNLLKKRNYIIEIC